MKSFQLTFTIEYAKIFIDQYKFILDPCTILLLYHFFMLETIIFKIKFI